MVKLEGEGRICKLCDEFKTWDNFYASNRARCKDCLRDYDRNRRASNCEPISPCVLDPELVSQFGKSAGS